MVIPHCHVSIFILSTGSGLDYTPPTLMDCPLIASICFVGIWRSDDNRKSFEIQSLEVWGCGGDSVVTEALGERLKARAIIDANIRKAKKVDKAAFLDDFNSGLIESKAFKHRGEIQGCEGGDFDPDNALK